MTEFGQWLAGGAGTILLALLAGAGGSALLELLWRPRRDRRRAAALVVADVALNTELLILQSHARQANPTGVPADFRLSLAAWEAAGSLVSELPPKLLRGVVLLFSHYQSLNRSVVLFGEELATFEAAAPGSKQREKAERMVLGLIDTFNIGIDTCIERGQVLLPELANLAGITETEADKANDPDFATKAAAAITERQERIARFKEKYRPG